MLHHFFLVHSFSKAFGYCSLLSLSVLVCSSYLTSRFVNTHTDTLTHTDRYFFSRSPTLDYELLTFSLSDAAESLITLPRSAGLRSFSAFQYPGIGGEMFYLKQTVILTCLHKWTHLKDVIVLDTPTAAAALTQTELQLQQFRTMKRRAAEFDSGCTTK